MAVAARPVQHGSKWRIRWIDETGRRRSEVHDEHRHALRALHAHRTKVEEIRRGARRPDPPEKTFSDLCDLWLTTRAAVKRSRKSDESRIEVTMSAFAPSRAIVRGLARLPG